MEIIPRYATLHHKCAFEICGKNVMDDVRRILLCWVARKVNRNKFFRESQRWFYKGNECENISKIQIRTALCSQQKEPLVWGMELIHDDSAINLRKWSVEVTLKKETENYRFVTTTKHFLIPYYIGNELSNPAATMPSYVVDILNEEKLICTRGGVVISPKPIFVQKKSWRLCYS